MHVQPDLNGFETAYGAGQSQVVWTTLIADLETPVSAFLKLAAGRAHGFLFESVEGGANIGRYSFLGLKPDLIWRCFGERAEINRHARYDAKRFEPAEESGLESLRSLIEDRRGNVSIEMAFLVTFLLVLVMGAYDFGRLAMEQSTVTQAARAGALARTAEELHALDE